MNISRIPSAQVDPRKFEFKTDQDSFNETNTVVFSLDIRCYRDRNTKETVNGSVYSSALKWLPTGSKLSEDAPFTKCVLWLQSSLIPHTCSRQVPLFAVLREHKSDASHPRLSPPPCPRRVRSFTSDQSEQFPEGIFPVHDDILLAKARKKKPGKTNKMSHSRATHRRQRKRSAPHGSDFARIFFLISLSDEAGAGDRPRRPLCQGEGEGSRQVEPRGDSLVRFFPPSCTPLPSHHLCAPLRSFDWLRCHPPHPHHRYELVPEIILQDPMSKEDAEKFIRAVHPTVGDP